MNTEAPQDQTAPLTTGERLRQGREKLELSQQAVAERLCLKVSTVRDIEEDKAPVDLASTFLRGYIRSYAKLVHISEDELTPLLEKQAPLKAAKVAPMQSFSLGKKRKKRDGWLMMFTWLVVFVVIGLTGSWWWQNHKAQQEDIATMANESSAQLAKNGQLQSSDPSNGSDDVAAATDTQQSAATPPDSSATDGQTANVPASSTATAPVANAETQQSQNNAVVSPSQAPIDTTTNANAATLPTASATVDAAAVVSNNLVMKFNADCWLEVKDSTGKTLFSGMQKSGASLDLAGTAPYKLKIGAPAAVQITYQGKPVDLSRFVKSSQVARLTLNAE